MSSECLADLDGLVTLPGEVYPPAVTVVGVGGRAEPCCGTHLRCTADIGGFVVVSCRTASQGKNISMINIDAHVVGGKSRR